MEDELFDIALDQAEIFESVIRLCLFSRSQDGARVRRKRVRCRRFAAYILLLHLSLVKFDADLDRVRLQLRRRRIGADHPQLFRRFKSCRKRQRTRRHRRIDRAVVQNRVPVINADKGFHHILRRKGEMPHAASDSGFTSDILSVAAKLEVGHIQTRLRVKIIRHIDIEQKFLAVRHRLEPVRHALLHHRHQADAAPFAVSVKESGNAAAGRPVKLKQSFAVGRKRLVHGAFGILKFLILGLVFLVRKRTHQIFHFVHRDLGTLGIIFLFRVFIRLFGLYIVVVKLIDRIFQILLAAA